MENKPKVIQLSENCFQVLNHSIIFKNKPGRRLLLCSCMNHTKFCNENPFCYHKERVLEYIFTKQIREKIDNLIPVYENWVKCNLPINPELCLNDLKNLKRIIR